jgi:uncharacterized protein YjbI with pentapeptide repeats
MAQIKITQTEAQLEVQTACLDDSRFQFVQMQRCYFENISLSGTKISDADLSDLEVDGAQLGGAYFHDIGMPPEGHSMYEPEARQRPLRFENCDLTNSEIRNCNLDGVELNGCTMSGMKINGIPVEELLKAYEQNDLVSE